MTACVCNIKSDENSAGASNVEFVENISLTNRELTQWKTAVTRDVLELKRRITLLEQKKSDTSDCIGNSKASINGSKRTNSASVSTATRVSGISRTPVVVLQIFWLLVCLATFTSIGIIQFHKADASVHSEWKPEKKAYVIDYASQKSTVQYDMPNVWLTFGLVSSTSWTAELLDDTLAQLLEMQDDFYTAHFRYDSGVVGNLTCEWSGVESMDIWGNNISWGALALKFSSPDSSGFFNTILSLNMSAFSELENVDNVIGVHIAVDRNPILWYDGPYLPTPIEYFSMVGIEYEETVLHRLDGERYYSLATDLGWEYEQEGQEGSYASGFIMFVIKGDLSVEHWQEYVHYNYIDWFMAMGGLFSVCLTAFIFVASLIPGAMHNNATMGILPILSMSCYNYEKVNQFGELVSELVKQEEIS